MTIIVYSNNETFEAFSTWLLCIIYGISTYMLHKYICYIYICYKGIFSIKLKSLRLTKVEFSVFSSMLLAPEEKYLSSQSNPELIRYPPVLKTRRNFYFTMYALCTVLEYLIWKVLQLWNMFRFTIPHCRFLGTLIRTKMENVHHIYMQYHPYPYNFPMKMIAMKVGPTS